MKKDLNHHSIKQLLEQSTVRISPATLEKLQAARTRALEHHHQHAPALAWLGHLGSHRTSSHSSKQLHWAMAVLFIACLFSGVAYWQNSVSDHDISELDIAILTDDLPLHAYVDD
jgi:hypothetical protein